MPWTQIAPLFVQSLARAQYCGRAAYPAMYPEACKATASHLVGLACDLVAQGCNPCDLSRVGEVHWEDEVSSGLAGAHCPFGPALLRYFRQATFACTTSSLDARYQGAKWRVQEETPSLDATGDSRAVLDVYNSVVN